MVVRLHMNCYCKQGKLALIFVMGLTISYLFPIHFVVKLLVVIMIILAISLIRC